MKKKLFFAAMAIVALASCSSDEIIGDSPSPTPEKASNAINFGFEMQKMTRGSIYGPAAAELLGGHFYVTGTKGTEAADSPTPTLVFDNYLVHYGVNTAGTTESNTANWDYVGVIPGTAPDVNYVKLSSLNTQTIKYWDYSVPQYDFLAFSTGSHKAVSSTTPAAGEIGVTASKYGTALAGDAVAYTFYIPDVAAIQQAYITDITEVGSGNYGKEVTLRFKNLGSKVRIALYETIPGYSVKDVNFYALDGTNSFVDANKNTTAKLISANTNGIPTKGTIEVYFPHVGNNDASEADYNKASATVTSPASGATYEKSPVFGTLENLFAKENAEDDVAGTNKVYLGRTLPDATFAGSKEAAYYQTVFPVSSSSALTLRVDYTLVSTDGSKEEIKVYGAKAVVPATYTKWLPNYAYTYIFKISDNTNGWTGTVSQPAGLFPITFDAVVAEATDATGEQTTITTVATPTITTYQQGHTYATNEYSNTTGKNVYVQVMNNSTVPATLVTTLSNTNSLLYAVSDADATEAEVMDALEKRITAIDAANVTGRNGIILTKDATNISNAVDEIVNGVDDNPIDLRNAAKETGSGYGKAAMLNMGSLNAGTYAYVYDYTSGAKNTVTELQPIAVTGSTVGESGKTYYSITATTLDGIAVTTAAETITSASNAYIYFSKTTNGTGVTTYSYISIAGKLGQTLPKGVVKVAKSDILTDGNKVGGGATAVAGTFYFDTYITNDGKYAVKVIKIV